MPLDWLKSSYRHSTVFVIIRVAVSPHLKNSGRRPFNAKPIGVNFAVAVIYYYPIRSRGVT